VVDDAPREDSQSCTRLMGTVGRWLAWALVGAGAGLLGGMLLGNRRVTVRGISMLPLLADHDGVLVDRLGYWLHRPRRGDIVLVRGGAGVPPLMLKRLVGLPGEEVAVYRDRLWVNGRPLDLERPVVGSGPGRWTLGPAAYFVLSENLALGTDSRHTGPVQRADVLGRAWLVYTPAVRRL
jgi:signal peptidase I